MAIRLTAKERALQRLRRADSRLRAAAEAYADACDRELDAVHGEAPDHPAGALANLEAAAHAYAEALRAARKAGAVAKRRRRRRR